MNDLRTISFQQIDEIRNAVHCLSLVDAEDIEEKELSSLGDCLHSLQNSIRNYKPTTVCQWIKALFTGLFIKKKTLQHILPDLIKKVTDFAIKHAQTDSDSQKKEKTLIDRNLQVINGCIAAQEGVIGQLARSQWDQKEFQKTAAKVRDYFQNCKRKLEQGVFIPIPTWYHATKDKNIKTILKSGRLKQSITGARGKGVYISVGDEHVHYGPHTFAIGQEFLNKKMGRAFYGFVNRKWVAVQSDIPLNNRTIAFVATAAGNVSSLQATFKSLKSTIPVIDRKEEELIQKILESVPYVAKVPAHWEQARRY